MRVSRKVHQADCSRILGSCLAFGSTGRAGLVPHDGIDYCSGWMTGTTLSGRRPLILAIDDDHEIVDFYERTLVGAGYDVVTVLSGLQLLDAVRASGRPDLILLDYLMPTMDGVQVLKLLGDFVTAGKTPVILCSSMTERKYVTSALTSGAVDYLTKPFTAEDLLLTVGRYVRPGPGQ